MSWLSSALKGVGKVVKVAAAPLAVGALAIPGVGAGVSGLVMKAAGALGSMQRAGNKASVTPAAIIGDGISAYQSELNKGADTPGQTDLGKLAAAGADQAAKLKTYAIAGAAVVGSWLLFFRRKPSTSYGRR